MAASLRVLARLWVAGATGNVRRNGAPGPIARLCRGGVVCAHELDALRASLGDRLHFDPAPVPGPSDRAALADLLRLESLALVGPPDAAAAEPELVLLAPARALDELGLHASAGGVHDRERHARLLALERLGLARLRHPEGFLAAPPATAAAPTRTSDEELGHAAGPHLAELAWADAWEEDDDDLAGAVESVKLRMQLGQWELAERLLAGLRDRRLDNPLVLALLAVARVGDVRHVDAQRVEDARRWALLARQLGSGSVDTVRVLETAALRIAQAEAALGARLPAPEVRVASARGAS